MRVDAAAAAMGRIVRLLGASALAAIMGVAAPGWAGGRKTQLYLRPGVTAEQAYTDNLRGRAGPKGKGAFFSTFTAGMELDNGGFRLAPEKSALNVRGRVFSGFAAADFVEIRPETLYRLRRADLLLRYTFSPRRLLFQQEEDGGDDVFYAEHELHARLRYRFGRTKRLRVKAQVENEWRDYRSRFKERDSSTPGVAANISYRIAAFFVPRVGIEYAERHARTDNWNREEIGFLAGCDGRLFKDIRVRFRYRRWWRDYTVRSDRDPMGGSNGNFGREDDIEQYEAWVMVPLRVVRGLTLGTRYKFRRGDSTRAGRDFSLHEIGLQLAYAFSWPGEP